MRRSTKAGEIRYRGAKEIDPERVTDVFAFRGPVNLAGYEWLKGTDGRPRLIQRRVPGVGLRPCVPHPGLFREFSELAPTKEAISAFANSYGDLFSRYDPEQGAVRHDGTVGHGASLGTWTKEIGDMRVLVNLWDQVRTQQLTELAKIIKRTEKVLSYAIATPRRHADAVLAHADIGSGLSSFGRDDVLFPARCALQLEVNKRIAENPTVPRLVWTPDYHQRIIFDPPNLLAAMWMQFAQDMAGAFRLVKCEGCGKYFQVGLGARKANATTHNAACRQEKKRRKDARLAEEAAKKALEHKGRSKRTGGR